MSAVNYIPVLDFMKHLKDNGLVIVSLAEFESIIEVKRKKLMRRKSLTLAEIADNKLLPVKSKKTVNDWILTGKIKPDETYREQTGKKRVMVLTSAIRRLGYED
jgi:hypothetical protein